MRRAGQLHRRLRHHLGAFFDITRPAGYYDYFAGRTPPHPGGPPPQFGILKIVPDYPSPGRWVQAFKASTGPPTTARRPATELASVHVTKRKRRVVIGLPVHIPRYGSLAPDDVRFPRGTQFVPDQCGSWETADEFVRMAWHVSGHGEVSCANPVRR
jgi:hypothetical protein